MSATASNALADRFAWMIAWFCKLMGAEACRRRMDGPVALAARRRLRRYGKLFASLYAKWQAGKLPASRQRQAAARPDAARPPWLALPRRPRVRR